MLSIIAQTLAAYFVLDLLTGIYHLATDKGWNVKHQVELFNDHHTTNTMQGYDWQPLLLAVPGFVAGVYWSVPFLIALGVLAVFTQVPHYFAHHPPKSGPIPWLQKAGIIISPEHHDGHHQDNFEQNFCVFTGWGDLVLNPIVRLFSGSRSK